MADTKNYELEHVNSKWYTCCGDVLQLFEYESPCSRNYSLYKICNHRNFNGWFYIMMIEDDQFPVPLTEQEAMSFIKDPSKGATFALNTYFDRYR